MNLQPSTSAFGAAPLHELVSRQPGDDPLAQLIGIFNRAYNIGCSREGVREMLARIYRQPTEYQTIPHFGGLKARRVGRGVFVIGPERGPRFRLVLRETPAGPVPASWDTVAR